MYIYFLAIKGGLSHMSAPGYCELYNDGYFLFRKRVLF